MNVFLFDIDGTLLSSGGAGKDALETALKEDFGVELRVHVPYSGRTDRAIVRELLHAHDIEESPAVLRKLLAGYLRRLPACLKNRNGRVLPGIRPLLETMRQRTGAAVGLLTGNVHAGAKAKLGHFGLYEHFAFGGFGDRHFDRDDVAREALDTVRQHRPAVDPEHIWVIGDTPLDIRCARAIGAKVLAVATGLHSVEELGTHGPDLLLSDLSDAQPFMDRWI